ncbi:MAG TPA: NADP-dependent oxidoreductase [Solirubrobacteraceae bacterium]|nr:NADP-dependent oxidoreductase [Solirubrobacteraceae bacterium]
MRAVRFERYGGVDVLDVLDVPAPEPGAGEVLVEVKAAGINPGEASIREGRMRERFPATFPSGEGSDFAGVVREVGADVRAFGAGEEVIGFTNGRASHAEQVVTEQALVVRKPPAVPWQVAGALPIAGMTAYAAVRAVAPAAGETVVVSAAAGGVGSLAVQLARHAGATVIGLASVEHHPWLQSHGIVPLEYGDGVAGGIRTSAPDGVDAFIDAFGGGYVEMAVELGVAPERINTIIDFEAAQKYGAKTDGSAAGSSADVLAELARLVAAGELDVPIARAYPLEDVRIAYTELEHRHTLGKIVLVP